MLSFLSPTVSYSILKMTPRQLQLSTMTMFQLMLIFCTYVSFNILLELSNVNTYVAYYGIKGFNSNGNVFK